MRGHAGRCQKMPGVGNQSTIKNAGRLQPQCSVLHMLSYKTTKPGHEMKIGWNQHASLSFKLGFSVRVLNYLPLYRVASLRGPVTLQHPNMEVSACLDDVCFCASVVNSTAKQKNKYFK